MVAAFSRIEILRSGKYSCSVSICISVFYVYEYCYKAKSTHPRAKCEGVYKYINELD